MLEVTFCGDKMSLLFLLTSATICCSICLEIFQVKPRIVANNNKRRKGDEAFITFEARGDGE